MRAGRDASLFLGGAQMGLAYDELLHIPAGYTFVDTGVRRSTTEHAPLGHLLSGLALSTSEPYYSRRDYLRADFSGAAFDSASRWERPCGRSTRALGCYRSPRCSSSCLPRPSARRHVPSAHACATQL